MKQSKLLKLAMVTLVAGIGLSSPRADGQSARLTKRQPTTTAPATDNGKSHFQDGAFYKITSVVDGQELALTFVLPGDACSKDAQTNCASKARVELQKFKGAPTQLWQPELIEVTPANSYKLRPRYSDADSYLSGLLRVLSPDNRFLENDAEYAQKHNRVSVGVNTPETIGLWVITKLPGNKFRIASLKGVEIKKANEDPYPETWNELRSLEAYTTKDGRYEVRHGKNADTPNQMWSFTKVQ